MSDFLSMALVAGSTTLPRSASAPLGVSVRRINISRTSSQPSLGLGSVSALRTSEKSNLRRASVSHTTPEKSEKASADESKVAANANESEEAESADKSKVEIAELKRSLLRKTSEVAELEKAIGMITRTFAIVARVALVVAAVYLVYKNKENIKKIFSTKAATSASTPAAKPARVSTAKAVTSVSTSAARHARVSVASKRPTYWELMNGRRV